MEFEMELTKLQQKVFDEVEKNLKQYSWFSGVCIDNFPTDERIKKDFEECVDDVMMETAYWDAPNFMNLDELWNI